MFASVADGSIAHLANDALPAILYVLDARLQTADASSPLIGSAFEALSQCCSTANLKLDFFQLTSRDAIPLLARYLELGPESALMWGRTADLIFTTLSELVKCDDLAELFVQTEGIPPLLAVASALPNPQDAQGDNHPDGEFCTFIPSRRGWVRPDPCRRAAAHQQFRRGSRATV